MILLDCTPIHMSKAVSVHISRAHIVSNGIEPNSHLLMRDSVSLTMWARDVCTLRENIEPIYFPFINGRAAYRCASKDKVPIEPRCLSEIQIPGQKITLQYV
jgi:hypothetical protein